MPSHMSKIALLWLLLLVWNMVAPFETVEAQLVPIVVPELPLAACAGQSSDHIGIGAKFVVNGSMALVYPEKSDGSYEENHKFAFIIMDITEQLRSPILGQECAVDNPIVSTLNLNECKCVRSIYLVEESGWRDEGVQFEFSSCAGHDNLTVLAYLAVPDRDHEEFYVTTMPGSTRNNFTYTHPYVEPSYWPPNVL
jgi:hypothetical protein